MLLTQIKVQVLQEIFSRVGRVCKKDAGGSHNFRNKWTSFTKARLNCSVPGQYPFYFNQIQSISPVVLGKGGEEMVYAVFNTPDNSISGSAVCSFRMSDVRKSFDGLFKVQQSVNSNWLPLSPQHEPSPRPGQCHHDSHHLDDAHLNFIRKNVLLDSAVPSSIHKPHYIKTSPHERLTTVAVNDQMSSIIFVGTSRGRVLKILVQDEDTTLIEEIQLFADNVPVVNLQIISSRILALSGQEVRSVPVSRCAELQTCDQCLQDPGCSWSVTQMSCVSSNIGQHHHVGSFLYSLATDSQDCPLLYQDSNDIEQLRTGSLTEEHADEYHLTTIRFYSGRTLALACSSSAIIALIVGVLSGYCISKRMVKQSSFINCGHHYLEAHGTKWYPDDKNSFLNDGYNSTSAPSEPMNTIKNNLMANVPQKDDLKKDNISFAKNNVNKCKAMYL